MIKQFSTNSSSHITDNQPCFFAEAEQEKPSFLWRFVPVLIGLGLLTVLGVTAYSVSQSFVQELGAVPQLQTVEVPRVAQIDSTSAQDELEPMVDTRSAVVLGADGAPGESEMPPVQSPFYTPRLTQKKANAKKQNIASLEAEKKTLLVTSDSDNSYVNDPEIQSADAILSEDGKVLNPAPSREERSTISQSSAGSDNSASPALITQQAHNNSVEATPAQSANEISKAETISETPLP